eukprot:2309926-Ditylum_brightwellii.AAC.1
MRQSQKKLPQNFQEYLEYLPIWEKHLVYDNQELFTSTTNLATNIKLGQQLWPAMDGGAKNAYGSFGWVIANNSFKLQEGKGCAYGNQETMQLLRTESAGLLAVLRFIYRYIQYNNILINQELLLHFCNNSTVVS